MQALRGKDQVVEGGIVDVEGGTYAMNGLYANPDTRTVQMTYRICMSSHSGDCHDIPHVIHGQERNGLVKPDGSAWIFRDDGNLYLQPVGNSELVKFDAQHNRWYEFSPPEPSGHFQFEFSVKCTDDSSNGDGTVSFYAGGRWQEMPEMWDEIDDYEVITKVRAPRPDGWADRPLRARTRHIL